VSCPASRIGRVESFHAAFAFALARDVGRRRLDGLCDVLFRGDVVTVDRRARLVPKNADSRPAAASGTSGTRPTEDRAVHAGIAT